MDMRSFKAIIPAAGSSSRFGAGQDKLTVDLGGKPLLVRSVAAVMDLGMDVLVMVPKQRIEFWRGAFQFGLGAGGWSLGAGGLDRQDTVFKALKLMDPKPKWVLIHDGARPIPNRDLGLRVARAAMDSGAATAAVPIRDTVIKRGPQGDLTWVDRRGLFRVQTPQAFEYDLLFQAHAHAQALETNFKATDDAELVARLGLEVQIVDGAETNIKLTTPSDEKLIRLLWERLGSKGEEDS